MSDIVKLIRTAYVSAQSAAILGERDIPMRRWQQADDAATKALEAAIHEAEALQERVRALEARVAELTQHDPAWFDASPADAFRMLRNATDARTLESLHRWIPCEERMPEEDVPVLAYWGAPKYHGSAYAVAQWGGKDWASITNEEESFNPPTHWQPLPPAPGKGVE